MISLASAIGTGFRQSIMICCMDSGTSLFSGFVIFSFIGFMAKMQGVKVGDVADRGTVGLKASFILPRRRAFF